MIACVRFKYEWSMEFIYRCDGVNWNWKAYFNICVWVILIIELYDETTFWKFCDFDWILKCHSDSNFLKWQLIKQKAMGPLFTVNEKYSWCKLEL